MIKQFLKDVDWGELDFMVIDTPPGTSDEHLSLVQFLTMSKPGSTGAIIVTTPQVKKTVPDYYFFLIFNIYFSNVQMWIEYDILSWNIHGNYRLYLHLNSLLSFKLSSISL